MIKALIFDCFGLFFPDKIAELQHIEGVSAEAFQRIDELDEAASRGEVDEDTYVAVIAKELGWDKEATRRHLFEELPRSDELFGLVTHLRTRYKVGFLSNVAADQIERFISRTELQEQFDAVVISGDEALAKPDPEVFKLCCRRLDVCPEEAVMIDDTANYLDGAKEAGLRVIHYTGYENLVAQLRDYDIEA